MLNATGYLGLATFPLTLLLAQGIARPQLARCHDTLGPIARAAISSMAWYGILMPDPTSA